jgi:hypothetical protein
MTDQEFLIAEVLPSIPGYDEMTRLEAIQALVQYTFRHIPVSTGDKTLLNLSPNSESGKFNLATLMPEFFDGQIGVWCNGAATIASRLIQASGKADKIWVYSYGILEALTHTVVLFELDGDLYEQDPYFNTEFVDRHGRLIPYQDALQGILTERQPRTLQRMASKKMIAQSQWNASDWVLPAERKILMYGEFDVTADPFDKYALAPVTLKQFHDDYYGRDHIARTLSDLGHADGDNWNYLHLYPLWLAPPYGGTSEEGAALFERIKTCVSVPANPFDRLHRRVRAALRVLRTL